jgi:hypothetical protein
VDPLVDMVRQRTDELHRVADAVRRGHEATAVQDDATHVAPASAASASAAIIRPTTAPRREPTDARRLLTETSGPALGDATTDRAA